MKERSPIEELILKGKKKNEPETIRYKDQLPFPKGEAWVIRRKMLRTPRSGRK